MKDLIARNLDTFLESDRDQELGRLLAELHPADIAEILDPLDAEAQRRVFALLEPEPASNVLLELSDQAREDIVGELPVERLSVMVSEMDSDDAADFISDLPETDQRAVLESIEPEDSAEVRRLLLYDEDTAGGIMQLELVAVMEDETVADAVERIRNLGDDVEDLSNVFVVDDNNVLRGQIGLREMLLSRQETLVKDVMIPPELVVEVHEDQERVAQDFLKYDLKSAPVTDEHGRLLGRITVDDVFDVFHEEVDEDIYRMAGTSEEELSSDRVMTIARLRLPWLLVNLSGGLVTGYLVWIFKVALQDVLALVTFIPAIMALGGSVGIQSSTIVVRSLALGRTSTGQIGRIFSKELKVALVMGFVCGAGGMLVARLWHGQLILGLVVGLSMFLAITISCLFGTFTPMVFKRMNIDPALASGPLVTMCNDLVSILIYMGIATVFLKTLVY